MELHLPADLWIATTVTGYAFIIGKGKGASIYKDEIALHVVATEENFRYCLILFY